MNNMLPRHRSSFFEILASRRFLRETGTKPVIFEFPLSRTSRLGSSFVLLVLVFTTQQSAIQLSSQTPVNQRHLS